MGHVQNIQRKIPQNMVKPNAESKITLNLSLSSDLFIY